MKKTELFRKTVSIAAAAAALVTAFTMPVQKTATAADGDVTATAEEETLPTRLMNGDFEWPNVDDALSSNYANITSDSSGTTGGKYKDYKISNDDRDDDAKIIFRRFTIREWESTGSGWNWVTNYKFDPWFTTTKEIYDEISADQGKQPFYWNTTASDQRIELAVNRPIENWSGGGTVAYFTNPGGWNGTPTNEAANGDQFAELVATEQSSLYQNISTEPGTVLTWRLNHRARNSGSQINSMAVFIGPKQTGLQKQNKLQMDVFSKMVNLIKPNIGETTTVGMSEKARKIYSVPIKDNMDEDDIVVKTSPTPECNQEWTCWIITSDNMDWYEYDGTYTVPEGQDKTTFAFAALNSASDNREGNCLDNIVFGIQYPLAVTATEGGSGTVNGGGVNNETVTKGNEYIGSADAGQQVTITAKPRNGYAFVGANVNGVTVGIGEGGFLKDADSNTYTYMVTMDSAKTVELIFGSIGTVTYDLNGGTWTNEKNVHELSSLSILEQSTEPTLPGNSFLRWRVYAANGEDYLGGETGVKHIITYNNGVFTIENEDGSQKEFEIPDNADKYAIVLRAEYTHKVTAQPCTIWFGSNEPEHNDSSGGTVTVVNDTGGSQDGDTKTSVVVENGDKFTITATPNKGFKVDAWYYTYEVDGVESTPVVISDAGSSKTYTATFNGSVDVTIHARFAEIPLDPYLSVVAKDKTAAVELYAAGIKTQHGYVTENKGETVYTDEKYGGELYGNTIATGFFADRTFNGVTADLSGTWTINIPASGTFFKMSSWDEINSDNIENEPTVPNDKAQNNGGAIYKAVSGKEYNRQVKFYVNGPKVTGGEVVFGIVIDNLYAPNAQAGFRAGENTESLDVLNDDNSVTVTKPGEYDPTALDRLTID